MTSSPGLDVQAQQRRMNGGHCRRRRGMPGAGESTDVLNSGRDLGARGATHPDVTARVRACTSGRSRALVKNTGRSPCHPFQSPRACRVHDPALPGNLSHQYTIRVSQPALTKHWSQTSLFFLEHGRTNEAFLQAWVGGRRIRNGWGWSG